MRPRIFVVSQSSSIVWDFLSGSDLNRPVTITGLWPTSSTLKDSSCNSSLRWLWLAPREAMPNSWDKNDPKDAQVILHLLKSGLTQHYHDPIVHNLNDLQELSKTHHQVSLEKTRTQHRLLTHYLPLYFPEIARYHCSARSEWLWSLLIEFPTPLLELEILAQYALHRAFEPANGSMGSLLTKDSAGATLGLSS
jgi:hypothetical protein